MRISKEVVMSSPLWSRIVALKAGGCGLEDYTLD